ncbi:MFS transporter [Pseudonocardia sp. MH-G8]|uniref:MFS transporter n=1 Tax=Pseudonocardia sp. MH-G8 TaxID=1854588 RepID=UPI0013042B1B|nr:MFS transporter [Pseudonocardia sp. MH-G8]
MSEQPPAAARAAPGSGLPRLTRAVAITTLVVLGLSYVLNAMDRQVFPVLLPAIRDDLGFTLGQGGLLATIFTLGIGVAGLPTGYLLDRISRRAVMVVGILIFSAFTALTALAVGYADMFVYRALSGVGEAMQNAALFSAVGAYFFASRALALGSLNFAYGVGSFLGPLLGAHLATTFGDWRVPFYVYGGAGFVVVLVIGTLVSKRFTEQVENPASHRGPASLDHVPAQLYNRNLLLLAVVAVVVGVAMYGYIGLYPTFLQEELGFTQGDAGLAASMFGIGALVGLPAGWLGDRFNQRTIMIVALLVGSVVGYLLFNGPTTLGPQVALSFAEGAVASGFLFVNIYSSMQRAVRPTMVGRASGLYVASFYIPAAVAGYLFSALVDGTGWGGAALWQLTVLPLVGVAVLLFVDVSRFSNARVSAHH